MKFTYNQAIKTSKVWQDSKGNKWGYVTQKQTEYFADIYKKNRVKSEFELVDDQKSIIVEPSKNKLNVFEHVVGYIPCINEQGKEGYIRIVVGSPIKLLLTALILIGIIGGGTFYLQKSLLPAKDTPIKLDKGQMTNPNPANIRILGIGTIYAKPGQTKVEKKLVNVKGNAYDMTYTIALKETGEVLYTSKKIPPGYGIKEFNLSRSFKKGNYPITVTINTSAKEDQAKKHKEKSNVAYNSGKLDATLVVE